MLQVKNKREEGLLELRGLNDLIAERKRYHKEQESLITDLVESGNTELMSLNYEILLAKQTLRNIKIDIRSAAQDKVLLHEDLNQIRNEMQLTMVSTTFIGISPIFS